MRRLPACCPTACANRPFPGLTPTYTNASATLTPMLPQAPWPTSSATSTWGQAPAPSSLAAAATAARTQVGGWPGGCSAAVITPCCVVFAPSGHLSRASPPCSAATAATHAPPTPCAGRGTTFWNLYLSEKRAVQLPECGWGPLLNFIGSFGGGQVGGQWGGFSKGMPALLHTSKTAEHPAFMMYLNQPAAATARIAARPSVPGVVLAGGAAGRGAAPRPARRPSGRAQAAGGPGICRQALNYPVVNVTLATLHLAILDAAAPPPLDRPPPRAVPCWALPRSPVPGGLPASPRSPPGI